MTTIHILRKKKEPAPDYTQQNFIDCVQSAVDRLYGHVWKNISDRPNVLHAVVRVVKVAHGYFRWQHSVGEAIDVATKDAELHTALSLMTTLSGLPHMRTLVLYMLLACRLGMAMVEYYFGLSKRKTTVNVRRETILRRVLMRTREHHPMNVGLSLSMETRSVAGVRGRRDHGQQRTPVRIRKRDG